MKRLLLCLFLCPYFLMAQEPLEMWMSSLSAKGRIQVLATDAALMQQLAFWSERSLKQLEADWKTVVPFQMGQSLKIQVAPGMDGVRLTQFWQQGLLKQTITLSDDSINTSPHELARTFTRAMAYRVGLAAMPEGQKNRNWQVPLWLVDGSAHALLSGRSRALFTQMVLAYGESTPPYPETIAPFEDPDSILFEKNVALLCRWLFSGRTEAVWEQLSQQDFRTAEAWVQIHPGIGSLREFHQHWDVWWPEERNQLMAEYSIEEVARLRLAQEKRFIPAFYGLFMEEENRYQAVPFWGLEVYLDDPRFGLAMQEWIVRLQRIRFRQSPIFNQQVEDLQEAGRLAIQAANEKGRKRERLWTQALAKCPR